MSAEDHKNQTKTSLTDLLRRGAIERGYELVKKSARALLRRELRDRSLTPTELTHESYVRQLRDGLPHIRNRNHYVAMVTLLMKRILVDHARERLTRKRNGGQQPLDLDAAKNEATQPPPEEIIALAEAMDRLRAMDATCAAVVDHMYVMGCTIAETAALMGLTTSVVAENWDFAKAWLKLQLESRPTQPRETREALLRSVRLSPIRE